MAEAPNLQRHFEELFFACVKKRHRNENTRIDFAMLLKYCKLVVSRLRDSQAFPAQLLKIHTVCFHLETMRKLVDFEDHVVSAEHVNYVLTTRKQIHIPICFAVDFSVEFPMIPFEIGQCLGIERTPGMS